MDVRVLIQVLNTEFYTGVPDSQLRALCDYLMYEYGIDKNHHIIAVNEGNALAIAAGYHLATGKIPVVYMQNSGQGNVINPLVSLMNERVYAIPAILVIGWRGEPGVKDEPQHVYQGEITLRLLEDMGIEYFIISKGTSESDLVVAMKRFEKLLSMGKNVAFIVRKSALSFNQKVVYGNQNLLTREEVIEQIVDIIEDDVIISTTGKASRELFEIRERRGEGHEKDFLTVGSMGHSSSIALAIALNKHKRLWCIDGDGAFLMHMGAIALIGAMSPGNMVHIVINNQAHESVGGMPTISEKIDLVGIAKACSYSYAVCVDNKIDLIREIKSARLRNELSFIEVRCSITSRADLGRPTVTAIENKVRFMENLKKIQT